MKKTEVKIIFFLIQKTKELRNQNWKIKKSKKLKIMKLKKWKNGLKNKKVCFRAWGCFLETERFWSKARDKRWLWIIFAPLIKLLTW